VATSRLSPGRARGLPRRWLVAPQQRHAGLLDKIKRLHVASDEVYDSPALADLRQDWEQVIRKTVAKVGTRARGSGRVPLLADTTQK